MLKIIYIDAKLFYYYQHFIFYSVKKRKENFKSFKKKKVIYKKIANKMIKK